MIHGVMPTIATLSKSPWHSLVSCGTVPAMPVYCWSVLSVPTNLRSRAASCGINKTKPCKTLTGALGFPRRGASKKHEISTQWRPGNGSEADF